MKICADTFLPHQVIGELAIDGPVDGRKVSGVLVKKGFKFNVIAPDDLQEYAGMVWLFEMPVLGRMGALHTLNLSVVDIFCFER